MCPLAEAQRQHRGGLLLQEVTRVRAWLQLELEGETFLQMPQLELERHLRLAA